MSANFPYDKRPNYRPHFNDEMEPHRVFMDIQNDEEAEYSWNVRFTATDIPGIQEAIGDLAAVLTQMIIVRTE